MRQTLTQLADALEAKLSSQITGRNIAFDELTIDIKAADVLSVCQSVKEKFGFDQLIDVCGIDYSHYGKDEWQTNSATGTGFSRGFNAKSHGRGQIVKQVETEQAKPTRYAVAYHLMSIADNQRLRIKAWCAEDELPLIDSVVELWPSANWFEREAFDLFGIVFQGHPDLRRLLTDYGFIGHPFRKDFPLTGNVEMRYDADKGRVVYEPVSIEPRVLVPRVIRKESGDKNA
ncbi:MAG: NADH-quinone oxidoreductase subunit C [Gammaproteobacteria bacterium]|nr:NADH-quinone oxidoreductase subunit C [Gammaproteobacteria bacterium]